MAKPPRRISSAHVIAMIALFVALGGVAWAASLPKNSVGTKQLKNKAVATKKIKNHAVTRQKLANNAVGAGQLDLSGVSGIVKGTGTLQTTTGTTPAANTFVSNPPVLATVPGFGTVRLALCGNAASHYHSYIQMLSDNNAQPFLGIGEGWGVRQPPNTPVNATVDGTGGDFSSGGGSLVSAQSSLTSGGMVATFEIQFSRTTGNKTTGAHIAVSLLDDGANCRASAQTIIQQ